MYTFFWLKTLFFSMLSLFVIQQCMLLRDVHIQTCAARSSTLIKHLSHRLQWYYYCPGSRLVWSRRNQWTPKGNLCLARASTPFCSPALTSGLQSSVPRLAREVYQRINSAGRKHLSKRLLRIVLSPYPQSAGNLVALVMTGPADLASLDYCILLHSVPSWLCWGLVRLKVARKATDRHCCVIGRDDKNYCSELQWLNAMEQYSKQ